MLVLTRKPEEKIIIGKKGKKNPIVITILKVVGEKVSIGIEADKDDYPVFREELLFDSKNERVSIALEMQDGDYPAKDLVAPFAINLKNEKANRKGSLSKEGSLNSLN